MRLLPPSLGEQPCRGWKGFLCVGHCWRCTPRRVSSPSSSFLPSECFPTQREMHRGQHTEKGLELPEAPNQTTLHTPVLGSLLPPPRKSIRPLIPTSHAQTTSKCLHGNQRHCLVSHLVNVNPCPPTLHPDAQDSCRDPLWSRRVHAFCLMDPLLCQLLRTVPTFTQKCQWKFLSL